MNRHLTRILLTALVLSLTPSGAHFTLSVSPAFADPDERPTKKKTSKKKTTKKAPKKLSKQDIRKLDRDLIRCYERRKSAEVDLNNAKYFEDKRQIDIDKANNARVKGARELKATERNVRKWSVELRSGKTKGGRKHTRKEKDDLVRKINKSNKRIKKLKRDEEAIKRNLKSHRKRHYKEKINRRNAEVGLKNSNKECQSMEKSVRAAKAKK